MLITVKIGKIEREEISKNYFNKMAKTKIALIQMKMSSEPQKNMSSAIKKIKEAVKKKAQVVCLPELFLSNYFVRKKSTQILIWLKRYLAEQPIFFLR